MSRTLPTSTNRPDVGSIRRPGVTGASPTWRGYDVEVKRSLPAACLRHSERQSVVAVGGRKTGWSGSNAAAETMTTMLPRRPSGAGRRPASRGWSEPAWTRTATAACRPRAGRTTTRCGRASDIETRRTAGLTSPGTGLHEERLRHHLVKPVEAEWIKTDGGLALLTRI